jgi:hypothetical protein
MSTFRVYISHTTYCSGWDMDGIFRGTLFAKACRTGRWQKGQWGEDGIKMLDWDFTISDADLHFAIAETQPGLEVVMAPDLFRHTDVDCLLDFAARLCEFVPRVVIPVHCVDEAVLKSGFELAYPLAAETSKSGDFVVGFDGWLGHVAPHVTHILGGSPHRQMEMAGYFPNLKSVDGNSLFQAATRYGAFWNGKWVKTTGWKHRPHNEEAFRRSVRAVDAAWRARLNGGDNSPSRGIG